MKKGKRMKKKLKKKNKIKKTIWIIPFLVISLCYFINNIEDFSTAFDDNSTISNILPTSSENLEPDITKENTSSDEVENKEVSLVTDTQKIAVNSSSSESEDIKTLIENYMVEKGLNETNFAFFYYNVDDNTYYFYNENTYFIAASTIKVPVAMTYYDKINAGTLTSKSTLTYASGCYEEGAGTTASTYSVGSKVPLDFLLKQSIVNSDNTAVNILIKNSGQKQYRYDIATYTDEELPDNFYTSNITSAGYGYDVINYLYNNSEKYEELISYMKQSSMGEYLKKYIENYEVAHKYGSYNGNVHDYGIVYGEKTYLVGIFTKNISNSNELIANLSLEIFNSTF